MLLAAAAGGPRTLALLGAAGTGKTWLLNRLVPELRERGRLVRLEQRGEVTPQFPLGGILLVDEASRLDRASLEQMANQQRGLVILADVPAFSVRLDALSRPPATITLPTIDPEEVPSFVAEWASVNPSPVVITDNAVARLVVHSAGTPRLIVQLTRAALALAGSAGRTQITGVDIDDAAALKLGALNLNPAGQPIDASPSAAVEEQAADMPILAPAGLLVATRAAPFRWRIAAGSTALAAVVVAGWMGARKLPAWTAPAPSAAGTGAPLMASEPATTPLPSAAGTMLPNASTSAAPSATASLTPVVTASLTPVVTASLTPVVTASLTPVVTASLTPVVMASLTPVVMASRTPVVIASITPLATAPTAPDAATSLTPSPATTLAPETAPSLAPSIATAPAPSGESALMPDPGSALTPESVAAGAPEAATTIMPRIATAATPIMAPELSSPVPPAEAPRTQPAPVQVVGAPGLVFVARAGDTLAGLYAQIYRGTRPPPFAAVLAANPRPVRPGTMLIFPTPPDGWRSAP